jgi:hypothetical protein
MCHTIAQTSFLLENHNDKSYSMGSEIDKDICDINGFLIRYFTEKETQVLVPQGCFETT